MPQSYDVQKFFRISASGYKRKIKQSIEKFITKTLHPYDVYGRAQRTLIFIRLTQFCRKYLLQSSLESKTHHTNGLPNRTVLEFYGNISFTQNSHKILIRFLFQPEEMWKVYRFSHKSAFTENKNRWIKIQICRYPRKLHFLDKTWNGTHEIKQKTEIKKIQSKRKLLPTLKSILNWLVSIFIHSFLYETKKRQKTHWKKVKFGNLQQTSHRNFVPFKRVFTAIEFVSKIRTLKQHKISFRIIKVNVVSSTKKRQEKMRSKKCE